MDLETFGRINPCGLLDTAVTQIADLQPAPDMENIKTQLLDFLADAYKLNLRRSDNPLPLAV